MDGMDGTHDAMQAVLRPDRRHSMITLTLLPVPPIVLLFAASGNDSALIRVVVVVGALAAFPLFVWHAAALLSDRDRLEVSGGSVFVTRFGRTTEFELAKCGHFRPFSVFFIAQLVTFAYPDESGGRRTHTLAKYEPSAMELARRLNLARVMAAHAEAEAAEEVATAHLWRRPRPPKQS